jgi:hypothetical protein
MLALARRYIGEEGGVSRVKRDIDEGDTAVGGSVGEAGVDIL